MGKGYCRFCGKQGTSIDYDILLQDQNIELYICGLWEHYATQHNVLPPKMARNAVMVADPRKATKEIIRWRGKSPTRLVIYFVEKSGDGYNHEIGNSPDKQFIDKLNLLINNAK